MIVFCVVVCRKIGDADGGGRAVVISSSILAVVLINVNITLLLLRLRVVVFFDDLEDRAGDGEGELGATAGAGLGVLLLARGEGAGALDGLGEDAAGGQAEAGAARVARGDRRGEELEGHGGLQAGPGVADGEPQQTALLAQEPDSDFAPEGELAGVGEEVGEDVVENVQIGADDVVVGLAEVNDVLDVVPVRGRGRRRQCLRDQALLRDALRDAIAQREGLPVADLTTRDDEAKRRRGGEYNLI